MSSASPLESQTFREFEHAGWQRIPAEYDDALPAVLAAAAKP